MPVEGGVHLRTGSFVSEALYIMIMVPVCVFIAYMSKRMQNKQKEIKATNKTLTTAHDELATTHAALASTHNELETIHIHEFNCLLITIPNSSRV